MRLPDEIEYMDYRFTLSNYTINDMVGGVCAMAIYKGASRKSGVVTEVAFFGTLEDVMVQISKYKPKGMCNDNNK
jgi:hypothetical protein